MVNRGPSTGCDTCRQRRIKCDETRPACQNCLKRGIYCRGYRSLFERAHRDVTDETRRRCLKKSSSSRELTPSSDSDSSFSERSVSTSRYRPPISAVSEIFFVIRSIPLGIQQDYETTACNWFVAVFAEYSTNTRANADFLLHLFPMLQRIAESSPLHKAVRAVAVSFAGVMTRDASNADKAYANYASASKLLRESLDDPQRRLDDDVLMTSLLLEFYDSVNGHFQKAHDAHEQHLLGAMALIEQRESANYKNDASKAMVNHVHNNLLQHSLLCGTILPAASRDWYKDPRLPGKCFRELNDLSRELTDLLRQVEPMPECLDDLITLTTTIERLVKVDKGLVEWHNALPIDYSPIHIKRGEVSKTVRDAGMYGETCAVFKNLAACSMKNLWLSRRLMLLQRLHIYLTMSTFYGCAQQPAGYEVIPSMLQCLADSMCDNVPFLLGDIGPAKPAILAPEVHFPRTMVGSQSFPESYPNHVRHATTSGAWLMMSFLLVLCNLMDEKHGVFAVKLRSGQKTWIKQQLRRLHQGLEICKCGRLLQVDEES